MFLWNCIGVNCMRYLMIVGCMLFILVNCVSLVILLFVMLVGVI